MLVRWYRALGPLADELPLHGSVPPLAEMRPGNPYLWHPKGRDFVARQLSLSLEAGDLPTTHLLVNAPNSDTTTRWRSWLHQQLTPLTRPSGRSAVETPRALRRVYQLQLSEALDVRPAPLPSNENPRVPWRRAPFRTLVPALKPDPQNARQMWLQTGSRLFAVDVTGDSPKLSWELPQFGEAPHPSLLAESLHTVTNDRWVVTTPRCNLSEDGLQRATALDRSKLDLPWNRLWAGKITGSTGSPVAQPLPELAPGTWTGRLHLDGDLL